MLISPAPVQTSTICARNIRAIHLSHPERTQAEIYDYSVSATKTAVVSAGTVTVPCFESNVDSRVIGSLEAR